MEEVKAILIYFHPRLWAIIPNILFHFSYSNCGHKVSCETSKKMSLCFLQKCVSCWIIPHPFPSLSTLQSPRCDMAVSSCWSEQHSCSLYLLLVLAPSPRPPRRNLKLIKSFKMTINGIYWLLTVDLRVDMDVSLVQAMICCTNIFYYR